MGSRYFQRPENAISKAEEFIKVGKPTRALDTLYDVIKSKKRNHSCSELLIEQIMVKYLELCVDLKKSHVAKEGLFQYRNMCQITNVASLASVILGYLSLAEQKTEKARQESVDSVQDIDDLDNIATPEMILLSAVSGEDAQDRSDRKILMPWVKFLWDSYCQCLELLRTNNRVERLYHDIVQQAFRFCLKYQRKTEFRKLCDRLRVHLDLVLKQAPSPVTINLSVPETQQMNLDTRLVQLDIAIQMELWQEAYKAIEDIHGLMTLSKKVFQPKMMSNYCQKLALVFWKCGNYLFHAAAIFKHFQLNREMKKNISGEEMTKMASRVLAACLAVPIPSNHPDFFDRFIDTDRTPQEKLARLAVLLSLQQPPTRQSLIKDVARFGIVQAAAQPLQDLYQWLEVEFHPLKLSERVQTSLQHVEMSDDLVHLQQYLPGLREITLVRLLKQVAQVYQSITLDKLLKLAPFADPFGFERVIVDCVRHNDMQVRIDHRTRTIQFGTDLAEAQSHGQIEGPHLQDMPSEQVRTQLMCMLEVLDKSIKIIHPDKLKADNNLLRGKIVEAYHASKARDHQRILSRHKMIEERKEYLEKLSIHREAEEQRRAEQQLREQQRQEEERLRVEREASDRLRQEQRLQEIKQRHIEETVKNIAQTEIGKKVLSKMDQKELAEMDADKIMMKQVEELENEKRQLVARLKSQEKRVDHLERAKRKEEIPLLLEAIKQDEEEDKLLWKTKEENRIKQAIIDREIAVKHRDRLARMKYDKDAFMNTLLKQRKTQFEAKLRQHIQLIDQARIDRLQDRKVRRKAERTEKWMKEKAEEEQRKRDEELKRKREEQARLEEERRMKEEEEYRKRKEALDLISEKQAARQREIEAREEKARKDAREIERAPKEREDNKDWRRNEPERERSDRPDHEKSDNRGANWRRQAEEGARDHDKENKSAWRPGTGTWRDRERKKNEEWGPRREGHDEEERKIPKDDERQGPSFDDRRGPRDVDRRGPRDDDRRGPRDDDHRGPRDDDRRGPRGDDRRGPRDDDRRGPRGDDDRRGPRDDDRRGPRGDDRRGPRDDERSVRRFDDGLRRDDRGPRRDDRGPIRRDDDRAGPKREEGWRVDDDRGPRREDRPLRNFDDDRGPRRDDRGPRRDDRGPKREEPGGNWRSGPPRGPRDEERGPRREEERAVKRDEERGPRREEKPPRDDEGGSWRNIQRPAVPPKGPPGRGEEGEDSGWTTVKR